MDIWTACGATDQDITAISGSLLRLVESQEQVATRQLVSSLADQALLEEMLETSKPPLPKSVQPYHYLLNTPFRYPPLPHGSRFGTRLEPSLFYASKSVKTVLAEAAYYRFYFWQGMATPPNDKLNTQHTLFSARYHTQRGVQLQHAPFNQYQPQLTHRESYTDSQQLGQRLREHNIGAFEYVSARCPEQGINVALFSPTCFRDTRPTHTQQVLCETEAAAVGFYLSDQQDYYQFTLEQFLVQGHFPLPAS